MNPLKKPLKIQYTALVALLVTLIMAWAFLSSDVPIQFSSSPTQQTTRQSLPKLPKTSISNCPNGLDPWPKSLIDHERRVHSQTMQDGVLEQIFNKLGTTNKYFVEFGFDASTFEKSIGSNTYLLKQNGWDGLLMDGGNDNPEINLHQEMIFDTNIISLFEKYNVPKEPDYVSIDVDSCDIWILLAMAKEYRPRVITIEYNRNFPAGSTFSWPPDCSEQWQVDRVMGSSLGAVFLAAQDAGYRVVHVIHETDAFLVREDLAECLDIWPQWALETRVVGIPLHGPHQNATRKNILIDYAVYRETHDVDAARKSSIELMRHAPLMNEPFVAVG